VTRGTASRSLGNLLKLIANRHTDLVKLPTTHPPSITVGPLPRALRTNIHGNDAVLHVHTNGSAGKVITLERLSDYVYESFDEIIPCTLGPVVSLVLI
jgi:hypothetical protein